MKRRKLERILAARPREPRDYLVMGAVLLASVFALAEVLGGKESVSPMLVSILAGALVTLVLRQLMESEAANRRDRALKEYLDLRLGEVYSTGEDGIFRENLRRQRRNSGFFARRVEFLEIIDYQFILLVVWCRE